MVIDSQINQEGHSCLNCTHRCSSLFNNLLVPELILLNQKRAEINYAKNETIFKEGQKCSGLYCLASGKVKISRDNSFGNAHILSLCKPVEFLGIEDFLSGNNHTTTAVALEECKICIIEASAFSDLLHRNAIFNLQLIGYLAEKVKYLKSRIVNQSQQHMRGRLAAAILHVMDIYGVDEHQYLNAHLYRHELAGLSNLTTANVIRLLSEWNKSGIIYTDKRRLKILHPQRLHALSKE